MVSEPLHYWLLGCFYLGVVLMAVLVFVFFVPVLLLVLVLCLVSLVLWGAGTEGIVTVYAGQHGVGWAGSTTPAVKGWRDVRSLQVRR